MTDEMIDPEKLKALEAETAKLPRSIEPPREAWLGIRAAIDRESVTSIDGRHRATGGTRFWQQPRFLVAAAAALIAATSATTVIALRERAPTQTASAPTRTPIVYAQFASKESRYIETANRLETLIESDQSTLSPETIVKLKQSLAIIDAAIAEARAALAADPANKDLIDMLSSSYDKKLDLLRRSAAMGRT